MKMLFGSSEPDLVEQISQKLLEVGIPCEIRYRPEPRGCTRFCGYRELWVKGEPALHWARRMLALESEAVRN